MADDGMISIIDFHPSSTVKYGKVIESGNQVVKLNEKRSTPLTITDKRDKIPPEFLKIAFALEKFDYDTYYSQYTTWTLAEFKQNLPDPFRKMEAWINLRVKEYGSKKREPENKDLLPNISKEQNDPKKFGVIWALRKAQAALIKFNSGDATYQNTRIPELQETAIRSFAMKCIAIKNGEVADLYDLGDQVNGKGFSNNQIRKAYLHHLLDDKYFQSDQLQPNPYYKPPKDKQNTTKQKPENGKTPKAGDAYSNDADKELAKAVRIAPELEIPQGKPIAFYFDFKDGSKFKQGGYTYKWRVSNNEKVKPKTGAESFYSIPSKDIVLGDNRVYCYVSKDGKTDTVIIRFKILQAEKNAETVVPLQGKKPEKASDTWSPKADQDLENALRVAPSLYAKQGDDIILYFAKESEFNQGWQYQWKVENHPELPIGKEKSYTIKTDGLEIQRQRLFCDIEKAGVKKRVVAYFYIEAGESASTENQNSETTESSAVTPADTWSKDKDLKKYLQMSQQTVHQSEPIKLFFSDKAL